jgi:hypothetical protein
LPHENISVLGTIKIKKENDLTEIIRSGITTKRKGEN